MGCLCLSAAPGLLWVALLEHRHAAVLRLRRPRAHRGTPRPVPRRRRRSPASTRVEETRRPRRAPGPDGGTQINASDPYGGFRAIEKETWLDRNTRAVFVEFTVYTPDVDILSIVQLAAMFTATGDVIPEMQFYHAGGRARRLDARPMTRVAAPRWPCATSWTSGTRGTTSSIIGVDGS